MMEYNDFGRNVVCIWYVEGFYRNFLATLFDKNKEGLIIFTYRFRYYKDDKAFDSKDEKSGWTAKFPGTNEEALELANTVVKKVEIEFGGKADIILREEGQSTEDFLRILKSKPWANAKEVNTKMANVEKVRKLLKKKKG